MKYTAVLFLILLASCAGPSESFQKRFVADAWFMPLGEFNQAIKDSGHQKALAQKAFVSMCGSRGEVLPKDLAGKLASVISQVSDKALNECFSRIITAQTAPFGTMPEERYNALVAKLFEEVKKRDIQLDEKWALSSSLSQSNLHKLFEYQIGFFYLLGHGNTLSFEARSLAKKMAVDFKDKSEFKNMGAYYDEDRVDHNIARFIHLVEKFERLRPYLNKACALEGERHEKGCARMKLRFDGLAQLRSVAEAAKRHMRAKREAYVQINGLQPPASPINLENNSINTGPSRSIASELDSSN